MDCLVEVDAGGARQTVGRSRRWHSLRPPKGERGGSHAGRKEHPGRAWPRSRHKAKEAEASMMREEK